MKTVPIIFPSLEEVLTELLAAIEQFDYQIGFAARIAECSTRQIEYWTRNRIVHPCTRDGSGRRYSFATMRRILAIRVLLDEDYTLKTATKIMNKELRRLYHSPEDGLEDVCFGNILWYRVIDCPLGKQENDLYQRYNVPKLAEMNRVDFDSLFLRLFLESFALTRGGLSQISGATTRQVDYWHNSGHINTSSGGEEGCQFDFTQLVKGLYIRLCIDRGITLSVASEHANTILEELENLARHPENQSASRVPSNVLRVDESAKGKVMAIFLGKTDRMFVYRTCRQIKIALGENCPDCLEDVLGQLFHEKKLAILPGPDPWTYHLHPSFDAELRRH